MALYLMGTLLSNHIAREYIVVRRFDFEGLCHSQKFGAR